eukprot:UN23602
MLYSWLTHDLFFEGIVSYLNDNSYSNAVTSELWQHLETASGRDGQPLDVISVASDWTTQAGYPVLTVSMIDPSVLSIRQERFFQDTQESAEMWQIPITLETSSGETRSRVLPKTKDEQKITFGSSYDWIKLNMGSVGFYRVNYSEEMWNDLFNHYNDFGNIDRINLVADLIALVKPGLNEVTHVMDIVQTICVTERNEYIWDLIIGLINSVTEILLCKSSDISYDEYQDYVDNYAIKCYRTYFEELGYEPKNNESINDTNMRAKLWSALGGHHYGPVITKSKNCLKIQIIFHLIYKNQYMKVYLATKQKQKLYIMTYMTNYMICMWIQVCKMMK